MLITRWHSHSHHLRYCAAILRASRNSLSNLSMLALSAAFSTSKSSNFLFSSVSIIFYFVYYRLWLVNVLPFICVTVLRTILSNPTTPAYIFPNSYYFLPRCLLRPTCVGCLLLRLTSASLLCGFNLQLTAPSGWRTDTSKCASCGKGGLEPPASL